ncbi:hypothetical protein RF11_10519 [Thelohanellus kitauei]|uniref:Uncharacterized protein n=1 Tax=Thelohanellus kitauei TaxID=669202 RepID=A0A0C2M0X7_THEKT|nr:hypothetical protein RF11_10519 [Thelohanellus kitauei]
MVIVVHPNNPKKNRPNWLNFKYPILLSSPNVMETPTIFKLAKSLISYHLTWKASPITNEKFSAISVANKTPKLFALKKLTSILTFQTDSRNMVMTPFANAFTKSIEEPFIPAGIFKDRDISNQDHFTTLFSLKIFALRTCKNPQSDTWSNNLANIYQDLCVGIDLPYEPLICLTNDSQADFCKFSILNAFPKSQHLPYAVEIILTLKLSTQTQYLVRVSLKQTGKITQN